MRREPPAATNLMSSAGDPGLESAQQERPVRDHRQRQPCPPKLLRLAPQLALATLPLSFSLLCSSKSVVTTAYTENVSTDSDTTGLWHPLPAYQAGLGTPPADLTSSTFAAARLLLSLATATAWPLYLLGASQKLLLQTCASGRACNRPGGSCSVGDDSAQQVFAMTDEAFDFGNAATSAAEAMDPNILQPNSPRKPASSSTQLRFLTLLFGTLRAVSTVHGLLAVLAVTCTLLRRFSRCGLLLFAMLQWHGLALQAGAVLLGRALELWPTACPPSLRTRNKQRPSQPAQGLKLTAPATAATWAALLLLDAACTLLALRIGVTAASAILPHLPLLSPPASAATSSGTAAFSSAFAFPWLPQPARLGSAAGGASVTCEAAAAAMDALAGRWLYGAALPRHTARRLMPGLDQGQAVALAGGVVALVLHVVLCGVVRAASSRLVASRMQAWRYGRRLRSQLALQHSAAPDEPSGREIQQFHPATDATDTPPPPPQPATGAPPASAPTTAAITAPRRPGAPGLLLDLSRWLAPLPSAGSNAIGASAAASAVVAAGPSSTLSSTGGGAAARGGGAAAVRPGFGARPAAGSTAPSREGQHKQQLQLVPVSGRSQVTAAAAAGAAAAAAAVGTPGGREDGKRDDGGGPSTPRRVSSSGDSPGVSPAVVQADGEVKGADGGAVGEVAQEEAVVEALTELGRSAGPGEVGGGVLAPGAEPERQRQQQRRRQQQEEAEGRLQAPGALVGGPAGPGLSGVGAGPAALARPASSSTPGWDVRSRGSLYGAPNTSCYHSPLQHITVSYKLHTPPEVPFEQAASAIRTSVHRVVHDLVQAGTPGGGGAAVLDPAGASSSTAASRFEGSTYSSSRSGGGGGGGGQSSAPAEGVGGRRGRWLGYTAQVECLQGCVEVLLRLQFAGGPLPPEQLHQDLAALGERIYRQAAGQDPPPGAIQLTNSSSSTAAAAGEDTAAAAGPNPGPVLVLLDDVRPQQHIAGAASASASAAAAAAAAEPAGAETSRMALGGGVSTGRGEGSSGVSSGTEAPGAELNTATPALPGLAGLAGEAGGGLQAVRAVPVLLCMDPPVLTAVHGGTVGDFWAEQQQQEQQQRRQAERAVGDSTRSNSNGVVAGRAGGAPPGGRPQRVGRRSAAVVGMQGDVGRRMTQFLQSDSGQGDGPTVPIAQRKEPPAPVASSTAAQRNEASGGGGGGSGGGGEGSSDMRCWLLGPVQPQPPSQSTQPRLSVNLPGVLTAASRRAAEPAAPLQPLPLPAPSASTASVAFLTTSHNAAEAPAVRAAERPTGQAVGDPALRRGSRRGIAGGTAPTAPEDGGGTAAVPRDVQQLATAGGYHAMETATTPEAPSASLATTLRPPAVHSSALHTGSSTSPQRTSGGSGGGGAGRRLVRASSSCGLLSSPQVLSRQRPTPGGGEEHSSNAIVPAPSPMPPSSLSSYAGGRPPAGVMSAGWDGPAPWAAGSHVGFRRMASGTTGGSMLGRESSSAGTGGKVPWGGTRRMSGSGTGSGGGGGRTGTVGAGELQRRSAEGASSGYGVGEWSSSGRFRPRCDSASSVQSDSGEATAETAEEEAPQTEAGEQEHEREGGQEHEQVQRAVEGMGPPGNQGLQQEQQQESTLAATKAVNGDEHDGAAAAPTPFDEAYATATECEAAASQAPGAGVPPSPGPWSSRLLPAAPSGPTQRPVPLGPALGGQPHRDPVAATSAVGGAECGWLQGEQGDLSQGASAGSVAIAAARRAGGASGICLSPGDSASSIDAHRAAGVCSSADAARLGPGAVAPAARPTMGAVPADWVAQQQQQEKLRLAGPPDMAVIQEKECDDDMWSASGGQLGTREGAWMDRSTGVRPEELAKLRQQQEELRRVGGSGAEEQAVLVQQNPPSGTDASCSGSTPGIPQQRPTSSLSSACATPSPYHPTPEWSAVRGAGELLGDAAGQAASLQLPGATATVHVFLGGVDVEKYGGAANGGGGGGEAEGASLRTDDGSISGWDTVSRVEAREQGGEKAAAEAAVRLVVMQHGLVVAEERMRVGPKGASVRIDVSRLVEGSAAVLVTPDRTAWASSPHTPGDASAGDRQPPPLPQQQPAPLLAALAYLPIVIAPPAVASELAGLFSCMVGEHLQQQQHLRAHAAAEEEPSRHHEQLQMQMQQFKDPRVAAAGHADPGAPAAVATDQRVGALSAADARVSPAAAAPGVLAAVFTRHLAPLMSDIVALLAACERAAAEADSKAAADGDDDREPASGSESQDGVSAGAEGLGSKQGGAEEAGATPRGAAGGTVDGAGGDGWGGDDPLAEVAQLAAGVLGFLAAWRMAHTQGYLLREIMAAGVELRAGSLLGEDAVRQVLELPYGGAAGGGGAAGAADGGSGRQVEQVDVVGAEQQEAAMGSGARMRSREEQQQLVQQEQGSSAGPGGGARRAGAAGEVPGGGEGRGAGGGAGGEQQRAWWRNVAYALRCCLAGFRGPHQEEAFYRYRCHAALWWDAGACCALALLVPSLLQGTDRTAAALSYGCLLAPCLVLLALSAHRSCRVLRDKVCQAAHIMSMAALWLYGTGWTVVRPGGGRGAQGGGDGGKPGAAVLAQTAYLASLVVLMHPASYSVRVRAHRSCWLLDAAVLLSMYGTLFSSAGMEYLQLWHDANSGGQAAVWPGSSSATSGGGGQGSECGSNVAFGAPATVGSAHVHILHSQGHWLYAAAGSAVVVGCSVILTAVVDLAWRLAFMASSRRKAGRSTSAASPLTDASA